MIGLIVDKLINVINERLLASSEFNNEKEKRFHSICSFLVGLWQNILIRIDQVLAMKNKSPFKFLFGSVPILSVTAFLGTKIYLTTMLWLYVTFKSIKKIPQVKEQVSSLLIRLVQIHYRQIICSRIYYRFATEILSVAVCSKYISVANL